MPYRLASRVPFRLRGAAADALRGLHVVIGPAENVEAIVAGNRARLRATRNLDGEVEASGIPLRG